MAISAQQPMRPAEIDILAQVNQNQTDIAENKTAISNEIVNRKNAIDAEANARTSADSNLQANINSEASARETADNNLQANINSEASARIDADNKLQVNIKSEASARETADNNLQANITAEQTRAENSENAIQENINVVNAKFPIKTDNIGDLQVTTAKLEQTLQNQLEFLKTVPTVEFGTSNTVNVAANSSTRIDISFVSTKMEVPIVLCDLQHDNGNLNCIVSAVTKQQFSVTVYNLTSTDVIDVTVDWLAISRR